MMLGVSVRRQLFFLLVLLCSAMQLQAQPYSFVYIQGDKQVPFYVKLEGEMLPRYGKNYCIISKLEPGPINVDILFQQNAYPPQHFVIIVPENGYRGFMITKKGDQVSLYDLQQQFYLQAGNTEADDHAPAVKSAPPPAIAAAANDATATAPVAATGNPEPVKTDTEATKPVVAAAPVSQPQPTATTTNTNTDNGQPKFLDNIELSNEHNSPAAAAATVATSVTTGATPAVNTGQNTEPVAMTPANTLVNSDCPSPLSDENFDAIYKKAMQQDNEESRLGFLNQQLGNCYTTQQAGTLAKSMDSDAARYTFLKKVFPRITDQAAFGSLEAMFSNEQWKSYFLKLLTH
jgi:hypothetical protein